jgi:hypothetical protein
MSDEEESEGQPDRHILLMAARQTGKSLWDRLKREGAGSGTFSNLLGSPPLTLEAIVMAVEQPRARLPGAAIADVSGHKGDRIPRRHVRGAPMALAGAELHQDVCPAMASRTRRATRKAGKGGPAKGPGAGWDRAGAGRSDCCVAWCGAVCISRAAIGQADWRAFAGQRITVYTRASRFGYTDHVAREEEPKQKRPRHPASLANLRPPIRPGERLNPKGINGVNWLAEFRRFALEEIDDPRPKQVGKKLLRVRAVREALFAKALRGSDKAQQFFLEQLQGRAVQQIHISGPDGGPIETDGTVRSARALTTKERRARVAELIAKATAGTVESTIPDEEQEK